MAKKTKDGAIVKGFKSLVNRLSPEAEKSARYKIQKKRGTYKGPTTGKLPAKAVYRGPTAEEKKSIAASFNTKKTNSQKPTPQKTASQKKREKVTALEKPKVSGADKFKKTKASASKKIDTNKKPSSKYFNDPNISNREKRIAKRVEKRKGRQDDRAERIALRKDITFDQAKELQGQRKAGRKQFLKNFAANLAGVEMNKGEFNTKDYENYKKNNADNSETNIVSDQQKSNKVETENNVKKYKSIFEAMAGAPNSTLGNMPGYTDIEV
jgi:hypothetical protein